MDALDNLRAVADRLGSQQRWDVLLSLCRHLFVFLYTHASLEGCRWYRNAIEHHGDLSGQERVDALGELDTLRLHAGEPDDAFTATGIALADTAGLLRSPWAWYARALVLNDSDSAGAKRAAEAMLAMADQRGDQAAALSALVALACVLAALDEIERSEQVAAETLRRGRLFHLPDALAMAVMGAAGSYLAFRAEPDFEGGMAILEDNPIDPDMSSPGIELWIDRLWAFAHLGLVRPDRAVEHLVRSLRLADQIGAQGPFSQVIPELAVALHDADEDTLAGEVLGNAEAHSANRWGDAVHTWLQPRLAALRDSLGTGEWASAAETGARLDRRGFLRLLAEAEHRVERRRAEP